MAESHGRTASAVTIDTKVTGHNVAIGQAIEQAMAETSKPLTEQTVTEAAFDTGIVFDRDINLRGPSAEGSGETRERGLASGDFASPAADLRADLTLLDPVSDDEGDPLQLGNPKPSREDLEDSLSNQGSQGEDASLGDMKEFHDRARGAISQSAGTAAVLVKVDDEGVHAGGSKTADAYKDTELGRIGKVIGEGGVGNLGATARQAKLEDDLNSGRASKHVSSDGKSTSIKEEDGTTTVIHKNDDGTTTTTTLKPDGSSTTTTQDANGNTTKTETTPAPKDPGPDGEGSLTPEQVQALKEALGMGDVYRGSHDNDEVQPVRDDTIANEVDETLAMVDLKDILLGGDRVDNDGMLGGGGGIGNHVDQTSQNGGATDWGPDHTKAQGSGPEERHLQHDLKRDVDSAQQDGEKGQDTTEDTDVIAGRTEVSESLPDTIAQEGPSRDQPIDPDRLVRVRGDDVAPAGTANDSDVARLIASTDRLDFVQTQPSTLDLASQKSIHTDIAGSTFDLHMVNDDVLAANEAAIVQHDLVAQPVFDMDFA